MVYLFSTANNNNLSLDHQHNIESFQPTARSKGQPQWDFNCVFSQTYGQGCQNEGALMSQLVKYPFTIQLRCIDISVAIPFIKRDKKMPLLRNLHGILCQTYGQRCQNEGALMSKLVHRSTIINACNNLITLCKLSGRYLPTYI